MWGHVIRMVFRLRVEIEPLGAGWWSRSEVGQNPKERFWVQSPVSTTCLPPTDSLKGQLEICTFVVLEVVIYLLL